MMEDPQAIADLLADDADDDFQYEEVEVMRSVGMQKGIDSP